MLLDLNTRLEIKEWLEDFKAFGNTPLERRALRIFKELLSQEDFENLKP